MRCKHFTKKSILISTYLLSLTFANSGCKSRNDSEVKADYTEKAPSGDETYTENRIIAFNNYAEDLLKYDGNEKNKYNEMAIQFEKSMKAIGIEHYKPLSTYSIQLGGYGECFGEENGQYNLWWSSHRDAIKKQIEEVAYFIRDFHTNMFGISKGAFAFKEVIVCPQEKIGSKMLLEGYKLYIGVPYSRGYYRPILNKGNEEETLQTLWDDGAPLGLDDAGKGLYGKLKTMVSSEERKRVGLKTLWKIFNPLSVARQGVRKLLHDTRNSDLIPKLKNLFDKNNSNASTPLDFKKSSLVSMAYADHMKPNESLVSSIANEDLPLLAANWKCLLENPDTHADLENDAMSMVQDNIKNTEINNDVMAGLVAVVNHHDVSVHIAMGLGNYTKYLDASLLQDFKVTNKVRAGLVAVTTSDNISVDARFYKSSGKALKAGTFEKAAEAAKLKLNLCEITYPK